MSKIAVTNTDKNKINRLRALKDLASHHHDSRDGKVAIHIVI